MAGIQDNPQKIRCTQSCSVPSLGVIMNSGEERVFTDPDVIRSLLNTGNFESIDGGESVSLAATGSVDVDATDAALVLAEDKGLDLSQIEGTGHGGRITKGDVENYIEALGGDK